MKKILFLLLLTMPILVNGQFGAHTATNTSGSNARYLWTGNVGIGTTQNTVPSDKLHVIGNARANDFISVNGVFNSINATALYLRTNGSNRVTVLNSGNVGIGTTAPAYTLDVNGTINGTSARIDGNTITGTSWTIASNFNFNSSANIGIGVASPAYKLDVLGTINATALRIGGLQVGQWLAASSNINYTAGMVSIGTTATPAGYKLAVGGKVVAEELVIKLQGSWPDYVFENDYKLMPLSEVEHYIKQNKHLPDVPTAKEVDANGVALGELNATLLKKVEELTLYMIELKKENEAQQKLIDELLKKD